MRTPTLGYGPLGPVRSFAAVLAGIGVGVLAALLLKLSPKLLLTGLAAVLIPSAVILSGNPVRFLWVLLVVSIPIHVDLEVMSHPEHYTGARSFYLDAVTLVAAALAAIALTRLLVHRERIEWIRSPLWVALAAYLLIAAATIPGSPAPLLGSMEVLRMGEELLLVLVVSHLIRSRREILFLIVAMLVVMFGETLLAFMQFLSDRFVNLSFIGGAVTTLVDEFGGQTHHRVAGTYIHPALFGSYLVVHLSLVLALLCVVRDAAWRAVLIVLLMFGLVALVLTFSRTEWVGFAVAAIAVVILSFGFGLRSRAQLGWLLGMAGALCVVGLVFSPLIFARLFESNPANLPERIASFRDAWQLFLTHPLRGVGLNNYMETVHAWKGATAHAIPVHNYLLMILAELGAPGLVAFMGVLAAIVWEGCRSIRASDPLTRAIAVGLLGAIIAYVFDFFWTFTLRFSSMSSLFWFAVGLLVAIGAVDRRAESEVGGGAAENGSVSAPSGVPSPERS